MTHDVSPGDLLDKLRTVTDPDIRQNIVTAGLVDSVSVDDVEPVVSHERGETQGYALRFLTGDIEGERLMRGVNRIDLLSLPADADPDQYETVTHEDPEYK